MNVAYYNCDHNKDFKIYWGSYAHFNLFSSKVSGFFQNPNYIFGVIVSGIL